MMVVRTMCCVLSRQLKKISRPRMFTTTVSQPKTKEGDVLFETINERGIITINKPKVLNAINLDMVLQIMEKLEDWEETMKLVIIKGAGGKAFCAGGDIVAVTERGPDNTSEGKRFFRSEYLMNNLIGTYKIPYIALIDGITMGGGVGLSVHGKYRIATENTLFAMPETAIGLFPDVGGGYFLPRLTGSLGLYLALTGHRLKGVDVVKAGIATHFVDSEKMSNLLDALINKEFNEEELEKDILPNYTKNICSEPFSLGLRMEEINRVFSLSSVEEILAELENIGSEWSLKTLENLQKMSPTSLKLTKIQLEKGKLMTLQEVFQMENRLAAHTLEAKISGDFYEGVRALLVDKDKKPKWSPDCLKDVSDESIETMFEPLKKREELLV